jgi:hypothetical protein
MQFRISLLVATATLFFSCKKDKQTSAEDAMITGSWATLVQLQDGNSWPAIKADSIRAAGKFNYVLNADHSGTFMQMVVTGSTTPSGIPGRWLPIGSLTGGAITGTPDITFKTVPCYWEYRKDAHQLVISDNLHQPAEMWTFQETGDKQMITGLFQVNLGIQQPGSAPRIAARVVFIKK